MGRTARAVEIAGTLGATLLSAVPFVLSIGRSLITARAERRRVVDALGRWDPPPPPASPPPAPPAPASPPAVSPPAVSPPAASPPAASPPPASPASPAPPGIAASARRLFVVAGEPSGDRIAAEAVEALRRRNPGIEARGFGGSHMAAAGVRLDHDLAADAVMGFFAVVKAAPRIVSLYRRYLRILDEERPDAVLLVDYPGFNIRAAQAAKRRGIPVVWFVVPQIWAWAPWRAGRIARAATDLCVILPFERAFYADRGIPVRYVGYPLFEYLDREGTEAAVSARLREGGRPVLAVLPGSRRQEIEKNLAPLLRSVALLLERMPEVRPVIACAGPRLRPRIDELVRESGLAVEVLDGHARTLLSSARAAACVSGTVTMECVHAGVPAVIVYRVSPLGRMFMPILLTIPWFGLANLLAGKVIYPEHANPARDVDAVAAELEERLRDGPVRESCLNEVEALRARVAVTGVTDRVAAVLEERLGAGRPR